MNRFSLMFLVAIIWNQLVFCQSSETKAVLPQILPASPEAASFAKYGVYPVSLYTGLPDISIPIYTIKVGELEVPISISYHASGIKVTDWGSWVGLGWNLNAGGMITRKIMGGPDDQSGNYLSGPTVKVASSLNTTVQADLDYLRSVYNGGKDCEPDIFSYNIPGKNGKFLYNQPNNFTPIIIPYDPIVIKRNLGLFDILDERGVNYEFHDDEYTTSSAAGTTTQGASAWILTKMTSPNTQQSITFTYAERFGQVSQDFTDLTIVNDEPANYASSAPIDLGANYNYTSSVSTNEKKIQEINFQNGKVVFTPSTADRADGYPGQKSLSNIKIFRYDFATNSFILLKQVNFYQSYFTSTPDNAVRGLRLDSVGIADANGLTVERYRFEYNAQQLPRKDSRARDYWGYYNGKNNNTLVPPMTIPYQSDPAHNTTITIGSSVTNGRDADPSFMQAGMLKRIYFPTGGYTEFAFETNKYKDIQNNIFYAGGLRVKSISSFDGLNPSPIIKTYVYGDSESGTGRANFILNNYFFQTTQTGRYIAHTIVSGVNTPILQWTRRQRTFCSNPTIDIEPYDGSLVVYPTVTEYVGDGNLNAGKTIYKFTDAADGISQSFAANHPVIVTYHINRGQLAKKEDYINKNAGNYQLAHSIVNNYEAFPPTVYQNVGFVVFKSLVTSDEFGSDLSMCPQGPGCLFDDSHSYIYANYNARSDDNRLIQTINTEYDQNDPTKTLTTTVDFTYGNFTHQQVTKIKTVTSMNDTLITNKKYPADYIISSNTTNPVLDTMLYYNMQDYVIEQWDSIRTIIPAPLFGVKHGVLNTYRQIAVGVVKPDIQRELQASSPLRNFIPSKIVSTNLQFDNRYSSILTYNNYDSRGNILQHTGRDGLVVSYQWGYNKAYPIAKVVNAINTANTVASPLTTTGILNLPPNNFAQQTVNFTSSYTGTIIITIPTGSYLSTGGTVTVNGQFVLTGPGVSQFGNMCRSSTPSVCTNPNTYTFSNLPPGNYVLSFNAFNNNALSTIPIQFTYQGIQYTPVGITEFFYEGFEENTASQVVTGNAYTGRRFYNGSYLIPYNIPNGKNYILQYWSYSGSWQFYQQAYTAPITLSGMIDEIRIFPSDAQIATFSYTPLVGTTSTTEPNSKKTTYDYDAFQRLQNIRDFQGNITKNFQYNYAQPCTSCIVSMQTFAGNNTLSYPVGVFSVSNKLLGNAVDSAQFISLWNSSAENQAIGTLAKGSDSMHFTLNVASGKTSPGFVTGCRYFQYDLPYTQFDAVISRLGAYVDFGDGNSMSTGKFEGDPSVVLPPYTNAYIYYNSSGAHMYWVHNYPNSSLKTLTFYHNDGYTSNVPDNNLSPASSLKLLSNLRGNLPQNCNVFGANCFQQASAQKISSITNWNTISSITDFWMVSGDYLNPCLNVNYPQDFMANQRNLNTIFTTRGYYLEGYEDATFKLSKLKTNWNNYFLNLKTITICDDHWNREDLGYLLNLSKFELVAGNQNHNFSQVNNPLIAIPVSVIDNIINQIAAGAGRSVANGMINISSAGTTRSSASDNGFNILKAKGWTIIINGVTL